MWAMARKLVRASLKLVVKEPSTMTELTEKLIRERVRERSRKRKLETWESQLPDRPETPGKGLEELFEKIKKTLPRDPRRYVPGVTTRTPVELEIIDISKWKAPEAVTEEDEEVSRILQACRLKRLPVISPLPVTPPDVHPAPSHTTSTTWSSSQARHRRRYKKRGISKSSDLP